MDLTNYFSFSRFFFLMKMELFRSINGVLMALVILFGLLFFAGFMMAIFVAPNLMTYKHEIPFGISLLAGGFILSSLSFNDLTSSLKRYRYLTLPASALEKFLCMWLLTSFGWIILCTLTYIAYSFLANAIGAFLFHSIVFHGFNPLKVSSLQIMKYYFVLQGIFMAGAATFKGYAFPKTLFSIVLFAMVCGLISYVLMADLFSVDEEYFTGKNAFINMPVYKFWQLAQWLFWWVLGPLSWIITYLGLKEKEV
jgi:hypothetical protein